MRSPGKVLDHIQMLCYHWAHILWDVCQTNSGYLYCGRSLVLFFPPNMQQKALYPRPPPSLPPKTYVSGSLTHNALPAAKMFLKDKVTSQWHLKITTHCCDSRNTRIILCSVAISVSLFVWLNSHISELFWGTCPPRRVLKSHRDVMCKVSYQSDTDNG